MDDFVCSLGELPLPLELFSCQRFAVRAVCISQTIKLKRDVSYFKQSMPAKARGPFICLCIALMCSDGRFTYEDLDFLEDCLLG